MSPVVGATLFHIGLAVFILFGFFACCEPLSKAAPRAALVGFAMVFIGGLYA